jgi:AraC-like DNA-binding protein
VDALARLLDGPRARGAFLLRAVMDPPWSLRVEDRAPLTVVFMVRGDAWVVPLGSGRPGEPARLRSGDVAMMRGPDPYSVSDDPATPPQIVIHSEQHCTTLDGRELPQAMDHGVRTWGNSPDGAAEMLVGTYRMHGEISRRLLERLPVLVTLPGECWDVSFVELLGKEIVKDLPGQEVVLDRLLDVLVVATVRAWFARPEAQPPSWYRALNDPVVGRALRMLHNNAAHRWSVAELAEQTGVSRPALARRFTRLVGEPPMAYLTGWRLALAADLLREPGATLGEVAQQVGYGSSFALSTAFKRVRGISPQEHRAGRASETVT